ncbi:copper homeostasis cutC -like protein [Labeo rohita]|uniref:Copper homeostasis cutC-like protein n=1 Tax=Labeo rohita TaxID=84645 RepID=A0A498NM18_LABRO|nr:copper homeostasis cutC -like protein [Labeo rohita]
MDLESPEFTPLFDQQLLAEGDEIEGDEEKDEEMLARLLREEPDDEEDDAILCAAQASRPVSALSGDMASTVGDCDLVEVCKRAAAKLDIPWPVTPGDPGVKQDIYDGKRLPSRLPPAKQLLPALPACIAEMKRSWDKPFSHRVPVKGYSSLDVSEMEGLGLSNLPTVEQSVAHHLHPNRRTTLSSASPSLPGKMERFTASMYQKIYKSSALAVRALNVTSLLTAYQAELLEELGTQLDTDKFGKAINEGLPIILCYFASRNTIGIMEGRYEEVLHLLTNNEFPVRYNKTARQTLRRYAAKFRVTDGMLYYGGRKAVKTKEECTALFCMSHISPVGNHCGKQKTRNALCEKYYWPGMTADIEKWIIDSYLHIIGKNMKGRVFVLSAVVSSALFSGNFQCVRKDSQETLSDECPEELPIMLVKSGTNIEEHLREIAAIAQPCLLAVGPQNSVHQYFFILDQHAIPCKTLIKDLGLEGMVTGQQASKKWQNLKKKYKDLRTLKTGLETDAGQEIVEHSTDTATSTIEISPLPNTSETSTASPTAIASPLTPSPRKRKRKTNPIVDFLAVEF